MSARRHPDPEVDAMDKWLERLYTGTISDENETLKARVIELEKTVAEAIADARYWKQQATRNAP
jgi:hypothetical protein